MRPVEKGGSPREYKEFNDALPDLWDRLGRFCSYCGRHIASGLAVEHKLPQSRYKNEELKWDNFLLACKNCNSCKGHPKIKLKSYLWPDTDNTMRAFKYLSDGRIRASPFVRKSLRKRANRTIRLLGLDKFPGGYYEPTDRDLRYSDRSVEWKKATAFKEGLQVLDTPKQRDLIVISATTGIFPIWWSVFEGYPDLQARFRSALEGTCSQSFDSQGKLRPRPGGQL